MDSSLVYFIHIYHNITSSNRRVLHSGHFSDVLRTPGAPSMLSRPASTRYDRQSMFCIGRPKSESDLYRPQEQKSAKSVRPTASRPTTRQVDSDVCNGEQLSREEAAELARLKCSLFHEDERTRRHIVESMLNVLKGATQLTDMEMQLSGRFSTNDLITRTRMEKDTSARLQRVWCPVKPSFKAAVPKGKQIRSLWIAPEMQRQLKDAFLQRSSGCYISC